MLLSISELMAVTLCYLATQVEWPNTQNRTVNSKNAMPTKFIFSTFQFIFLSFKTLLLTNYFAKLGLEVNVTKTQVIVFFRSERIPRNLSFTYQRRSLLIVKSPTYLGVPFCSNGTFSAAAPYFTAKGTAALLAVWQTIQRGRIGTLGTAMKLFQAVVQAALLYASGIWGFRYGDDIERVQCRYIKRILGVLLSSALVRDRMIRYWLRLLVMPSSRYAKQAYLHTRAISATLVPGSLLKYSWTNQLQTALQMVNLHHLWQTEDYVELGQKILTLRETFSKYYLDQDWARVASSRTFNYYSTAQFSFPLHAIYLTASILEWRKRLVAQLRVGYGYFRMNKKSYWVFSKDSSHLCGTRSAHSLSHFLLDLDEVTSCFRSEKSYQSVTRNLTRMI